MGVLREQCRVEVDQLANFSTSKCPSVRNKLSSFRKNIFKSLKKVGRKSTKVPKKNALEKERRPKKKKAPTPPKQSSLSQGCYVKFNI